MFDVNRFISAMVRRSRWSTRCASVTLTIALSMGAGGSFLVNATPEPSQSAIVTVIPERILDTREPNNVGLNGPFQSGVALKLQVTGLISTGSGLKSLIPEGATGLLLNVTAVNQTADGYISIRPGDAAGKAVTSSLIVASGVTIANAIQVAMPTSGANAGKIDITYQTNGGAGSTTDLLIDVVGYMTSGSIYFRR